MSTWQERYEQRLVEVAKDDREIAQTKALGDLAANSANLTSIVELLAVLPEIAAALGRLAAALEQLERMVSASPYPHSISGG